MLARPTARGGGRPRLAGKAREALCRRRAPCQHSFRTPRRAPRALPAFLPDPSSGAARIASIPSGPIVGHRAHCRHYSRGPRRAPGALPALLPRPSSGTARIASIPPKPLPRPCPLAGKRRSAPSSTTHLNLGHLARSPRQPCARSPRHLRHLNLGHLASPPRRHLATSAASTSVTSPSTSVTSPRAVPRKRAHRAHRSPTPTSYATTPNPQPLARRPRRCAAAAPALSPPDAPLRRRPLPRNSRPRRGRAGVGGISDSPSQCRGRDSNPQVVADGAILSRLRMPIPPPRLGVSSRCSVRFFDAGRHSIAGVDALEAETCARTS